MSKPLKVFILTGCLMLSGYCGAQTSPGLSYVDTEYILDQLPDFKAAQKEIDATAEKWKNEIRRKREELNTLKKISEDGIAFLPVGANKGLKEKIAEKTRELNAFKYEKFGPDGELFKLRRSLILPIQDRVYKAMQDKTFIK